MAPLKFFQRKGQNPLDWHDQARTLVDSVVRFLRDRSERKPTPEVYVLEKKLIFLLDDVRKAVRDGDRSAYDRLCGEIDRCRLDHWELRRGGFEHEK